MELQDDGITMGLEHNLSKDIISIINNVFQAPWGGSHTCQKDEKAVECNLCQLSILCYQLACELLERLAPKEESRLVVSVEELQCACVTVMKSVGAAAVESLAPVFYA